MSYFKCSGCDYSSPYISGVKSHINRKNKCNEGVLEIIKIKTEIACEYCDKKFNFKSGKDRHLVICKEKEKKDKEAREERKKDEIIKQLKKELKKANTKKIQTINNTNNTTTNNMTNNTQINNYITIEVLRLTMILIWKACNSIWKRP